MTSQATCKQARVYMYYKSEKGNFGPYTENLNLTNGNECISTLHTCSTLQIQILIDAKFFTW